MAKKQTWLQYFASLFIGILCIWAIGHAAVIVLLIGNGLLIAQNYVPLFMVILPIFSLLISAIYFAIIITFNIKISWNKENKNS